MLMLAGASAIRCPVQRRDFIPSEQIGDRADVGAGSRRRTSDIPRRGTAHCLSVPIGPSMRAFIIMILIVIIIGFIVEKAIMIRNTITNMKNGGPMGTDRLSGLDDGGSRPISTG